MFIRPYTWSQLRPGQASTSAAQPCIQLFGVSYDVEASTYGKPISTYLRIYPENPEQAQGDMLGRLFRDRGLEPYGLIAFGKGSYFPILGEPYTASSLNIWAEWSSVIPAPYDSEEEKAHYDMAVNPIPDRIYWDIETYSPNGTFTDPHTPQDEIVAISMLLSSAPSSKEEEVKGHVITSLSGPEPLTAPEVAYLYPLQIDQVPDERELLLQFFELLIRFPHYQQITFNGDYFDKPYVVTRAHLLELEKVASPSRIYSLQGATHTFDFPSARRGAVKEQAVEFLTPDIESIDLLLYFRRWRPDLPNYKLETVCQQYLGAGKTGLEIEKLFKIVTASKRGELADSVELKSIVDYSYTDSILLKDLNEASSAMTNLDRVCNLARVTHQEFLRLTDPELLARLFTRWLGEGPAPLSFSPIEFYRDAAPGIYRDVLRYQYKRELDAISDQYLSRDVAAAVKALPAPLQIKALHASYADREAPQALLRQIAKLPRGLVALLPYEMWYLNPLPGRGPIAPRRDQLLLVKGNGRYISVKLDPDARTVEAIDSYGNGCSFCKGGTNFAFKQLVLRNYIADLLAGNHDPIGRRCKSIDMESADLFVITKKVYAPDPYASTPGLAELIAKRGIVINTWLSVPCLRVVKDAKLAASRIARSRSLYPRYYADNSYLYPLLEEADVAACPPLDVSYYLDQINTMLEELDALPWVVTP